MKPSKHASSVAQIFVCWQLRPPTANPYHNAAVLVKTTSVSAALLGMREGSL